MHNSQLLSEATDGKGSQSGSKAANADDSDKLRKGDSDNVRRGVQSESRMLSLGDDDDLLRHMTTKTFQTPHRATSKLILIPGTLPCFVLDMLATWVIVVTGLVIPMGLTYGDQCSLSHGWLGALLCITDIVWIIFIIASCHTAFFQAGHIEMNVRRIVSRYVRTWFVFDVCAAFPLVAVCSSSEVAAFVKFSKLLRLPRLGSLFLRMKHVCSYRKLYPAAMALAYVLVANILACGFRAVRQENPAGVSGTTSGSTFVDMYIHDLYFIMTVMSTVGFGDTHPEDSLARLYSILAMVIAPIIFGIVMTLSSHVSEGIFNDKVTAHMTQASRFMKNRNVPTELQRRVQHNLRRNALHEDNMSLAPELLAQLSPAVQRELPSELLRSTVLQFPLFKGANTAFIGEIAQAHVWVHCLPGDIVVEEGQLMQEIVFIIKGKLLVIEQCDGSFDVVDSFRRPPQGANYQVSAALASDALDLHSGAWFGEASLFETDRTGDFSVVAVAESELAVLEAKNYHHIVGKYPRVLARHRHICERLKDGKLDLGMFGYVRPSDDENTISKRSRCFKALGHLFKSSDHCAIVPSSE